MPADKAGNEQWWENYVPKDQFVHLIAGGLSGGVSRTCVSPLERVKMLLQVRCQYCVNCFAVLSLI